MNLALRPLAIVFSLTLAGCGFFTARFAADGGVTLEGDGWPTFTGTWKADAGVLDISTPRGIRTPRDQRDG